MRGVVGPLDHCFSYLAWTISDLDVPESTTPPKPTTSSSRHSRPTTETFTSTNSDGAVVIVTATSFVWADPAQTDTASSTRPSGSLQTNAAALRHGGSELLGAVAAGVVAGGMLLM